MAVYTVLMIGCVMAVLACSADTMQAVGDRPIRLQDDHDAHWHAETRRPRRLPQEV